MLRQIINKRLKPAHYWRTLSFTELNEIYLVMLVRGISLSMVGLFVPIFLLSIGNSLTYILSLIAIYFLTRIVFDIVTAYLVAYFGPKHIMFVGQIAFAVSSALFLTLPTIHWPIALLGIVWGSSQSCFFMSFDVDFSKVKHKKHGGEELGYAEIMGRIGSIVGPLLGGVISVLFGARYIFAISTVLLVAGLLPLFKTREPVRAKQHLDYKGFPDRKTAKYMPSIVALHVENTITVILWPLFLALFVLPGSTVFIKVGILSATSMLVSIFAIKTAGQLVDAGKGRNILRLGAISNAALSLARPLVGSYATAFSVDVSNQIITAGYRLPFMKAHYDHADDLPGHRIVYISISEVISSTVKAVIYIGLAIASTQLSGRATMTWAFGIAAIASLIITTERFPSLRPKEHNKANG